MSGLVAIAATAGLMAGACSSATDDAQDVGDTTPRGVSETDITIAAEGGPRPGGKITYALEADSDGFDPTENRMAIAGMMVMNAVYDPLTALDVDLVAQPYLAESIEPNERYDEWTITVREGVTFHDGSPLTGEAVATTLMAHKNSILTASAVVPIVNAEATDDRTVVVTMDQAWVAFPNALTAQIGFIPGPSVLADAQVGDAPPPDDPEDSRNPVGTGPFEFVSWQPNVSSEWKKYDGYWREGLPYIDDLEFQTVLENQSRKDSLTSGTIDMFHTSDPETIQDMRDVARAGEVQIVEDRGEGEEGFVMLNVQTPPFDNLEVRRALALATDSETYTTVVDGGVPQVARGPFKPSSPWFAETDYPDYDQAAAQELVAQLEAEMGPISFVLATTPSAENQQAVQQLQSQWQAAGFEVAIETKDQTNFIGDALQKKYQANLWRQFGAPDPDTDAVWWQSEAAEGSLDLNFAGNKNPAIDAALEEGRTNPDPEARKAAYAEFQRLLNEDLPYIWLNHSVWAVVAGNDVRGITNGPLPDGEESVPMGGQGTFGGVHRLTQTWLDR
jgi:ABC-type transport system substrate-binding protein